MSTIANFFIVGLVLVALCVTASAAARRPAAIWNYYHFDGKSFVSGQSTDGAPFVAVRDGFQPVVTHTAKIEAVDLKAGAGAVVGICYVQSSGGKLATGPAYLPFASVPVQIFSKGKLVATTKTDEQGYFRVMLVSGRYEISSRETIEVTVEKGKTTLVSLRAGKRMVD